MERDRKRKRKRERKEEQEGGAKSGKEEMWKGPLKTKKLFHGWPLYAYPSRHPRDITLNKLTLKKRADSSKASENHKSQEVLL